MGQREPKDAESAPQPAPGDVLAAARKGEANEGNINTPEPRPPRTLDQRLAATLRRHGEALPPRALRRVLEDLKAIADARVSEVEGGRRATTFVQGYATLSADERHDVWLLMSECFAPDARKLESARGHYAAAAAAAPGSPEHSQAEVRLRRALLSPRARLLRRLAAASDGLRFLLDLRAELLPALAQHHRLLALDAELEQLFSNWFDVAFLELQRISWDSPASLVERLIEYEAVHDITSWSDVKNRLDERDRRCYGFFHPRLPGVPLIFIEVALTDRLSDSIVPLLDEQAAPSAGQANTAIFYSISNTQRGLRGVSFGDSLIKRVVETLRQEFPRLATFATLSPIPGLRAWLTEHAAALLARLPARQAQALGQWVGSLPPTPARLLAALDDAGADIASLAPRSPLRQWLLQAAAEYLGRGWTAPRAEPDGPGQPLDAVARFHLGNGARVERLNWAADASPKGQRQSWGLMVNYLYDPRACSRSPRGRAAPWPGGLQGAVRRA